MPPALPTEDIESESAHLVDFRLVGHFLGYARASIARHTRLVIGLGLGIFLAAVSSIVLLPKSYVVETKVLAQRNQALAVRGDLQGGEAPTQAAVATIMRRDNLVAIIRQVDLLHQWFNHRAPLAHLKDIVWRAVSKPETEAETTSWMADVLEKRLTATSNDGVVGIAIDWPDAMLGLRIVEAAQQNYLEARHATEITAIAEQVSILQNHAAAMRQDVDAAVDAIEKLRADRAAHPIVPAGPVGRGGPKPPVAAAPAAVAPRPATPSGPDPELAQLKVMIEAKQRAISDLEEFRRRRLSELNSELAEKSAVYTENHPVMVDLRQTIASLSSESPQVQALRTELVQLQKDFATKSAQALAESRVVPVLAGGSPATPPPALPGSIIRIEQESSDDKDPALMYARQQLKDAMDKYSALRTQIENAQIDFDTAEAAFKYRYSVVEPPLYPKKATKPNTPLVIIAGLLGGLFVAIFTAIAMDIRGGRFMQGWQVEQSLGLPMLTEIDYAALAEHKIE